MPVQIQLRHDTGANWTSADPTLALGEIGIETDASPPAFKVGDGATAWSGLPYSPATGGSISVTDGSTTVNPATSVDFTAGATVTDGGGGVAQVAITPGSISDITDLPTAETDTTKRLGPNGAGGVQWDAGGGGGPSDYVSGASGSGQIIIPGIAASADIPPASPSAYDDEFDAFSGWTTLGSLDTLNVTDFLSNVHMLKTTSGSQLDGIYKACPSAPFTVTAKFTDFMFGQNYQMYGLMIGDSTPTAWMTGGYYSVGGGGAYRGLYNWSSRTSRGSSGESQVPFFMRYIRLVVTSGSSIALWASQDGLIWSPIVSGWDSGFTPGYVGLFVSGNGGAVSMEAAVDWIRFS